MVSPHVVPLRNSRQRPSDLDGSSRPPHQSKRIGLTPLGMANRHLARGGSDRARRQYIRILRYGGFDPGFCQRPGPLSIRHLVGASVRSRRILASRGGGRERPLCAFAPMTASGIVVPRRVTGATLAHGAARVGNWARRVSHSEAFETRYNGGRLIGEIPDRLRAARS